MIKIRLKSIGEDKPLEHNIIDGESLEDAIKRSLEGTPLKDKPEEIFTVLVNAHQIPKEFWPTIKLKESDNILIAPRLTGDNQMVRSLAVVAITIAAYHLAGPGGLKLAEQWMISSIAAGASILGSMAINGLFPLPNPKNIGEGEAALQDSQMYTITSQSNRANKLGFVPKVYGTHRMFPPVAANPYTEFVADKDGNLIQYLHAIYDFGLGPLEVSDLRIGDTPISQFSDLEFRLVDFNKPNTPEGDWDKVLEKDFKYYKGDVTTENVGVTILKNQTDTPTPNVGEFQVVRTGGINPNNLPVEMSVLLVAPAGLSAYAANGDVSERKVYFDIEFAKEGTNVWYPFNDFTKVSDYRASGGDLTFSDVEVSFNPLDTVFIRRVKTTLRTNEYGISENIWNYIDAYGYPDGTSSVILFNNQNIVVGSFLRCAGEVMGLVSSITPIDASRSRYTFEVPTTRVFEPVLKYFSETIKSGVSTFSIPQYTVPNKIYRGIPSLTRVVLRGNSNDPVYATYKFWPREPGQYKVRVTRVQSTSIYNKQISDSVTWGSLTTRLDSKPIFTDKRHVFLEMRVRATNQLNGTIQNLSGIVTSVLDKWDGTKWVKAATNNPAWIYCDLLTGQINRRAVSKSRLDIESIYEWAQFCEAVPPSGRPSPWADKRFTCNFVLDFSSTLQQMAERVTSTGQATLAMIDGKYGVLIDRKKTVPVQIFTPRNSSNFSSTRNYPKPPHALDVQYIDPERNWEPSTVRVYADGFDYNNTVEIEELDTFGVTSYEQAWRFGRYVLASNKLRQENISIEVDYEHLVCNRGDYVQFVQDAMLAGGRASIVKSVSLNNVVLDDAYDNILGSWGYVFRSTSTGEIKSGTATPVTAREFELTGPLPSPGDLIVLGEVTKVVLDCIVKAISPKDDMAATLLLVEKADAIHDTELGLTIPNYDPQISPVRPTDFVPPGPVENLIVADSYFDCVNSDYEHHIVLDWDSPKGFAYDIFEIYADWGPGSVLVGQTRASIFNYIVDNANLDKLHTFRVLAVSSSGLKLDLIAATQVQFTPLRKTNPPSDVASLRTDITNEVLQLSWDRIPDCDVREYFIRYSPLTDGVSWSSSTPLERKASNETSVAVQARTGTYFIKAIDFNGRESSKAAVAITTIPNLFNLNIIETISDTPDFAGPKDRVVKLGSSLILDRAVQGALPDREYYSEGYYYYRQIIDLGDIYTARLQSSIQASGFSENDVIANWDPLASISAMATATVSDWDVEVQYRVSNIRNVMADWLKLEDIDPISEGVSANFSEWRKFTMGDATGRVFQFRLKLISKRADVTPRVFDGSIRVDMPDRLASYENRIAPATGLNIIYDPAFKGPGTSPNVQISIEDAQPGDRPEYIEKTLTNLKFRILDSAGNPVERTVDIAVKGYGYKNDTII